MEMKILGAEERIILRRIYGLLVEQRIWRVRTDQELRELYRDLDIVAVIKKVEIGMNWTYSKNGSGKDS